jgi:DNA-binding MarR family transcriptional regulator
VDVVADDVPRGGDAGLRPLAQARTEFGLAGPETDAAGLEEGAAGSEDGAGSEEFHIAFEMFAQAVRRARGAAPQARPGWLTLSQHALLLPLSETRGARVSDLAAEAGVSPSTATRILDALERRGMVRRARAEHDRRGVTVALTELGRETLARQDQWMRGRRLAFFDDLPAVERVFVSDLLVRLAGLIDDLGAGPPDGV